jgi:hypothetical protein
MKCLKRQEIVMAYNSSIGGGLEYFQQTMKRESRVWRYNWTTLLLGYVNTRTWSFWLGVGCKVDLAL